MTNCEELQIFENGVCIAERLGKCRGCAEAMLQKAELEVSLKEFMDDAGDKLT